MEDQRVCALLEYQCIKCTEPVKMEVRTNMTDATLRIYKDMHHAQLCLSCLTGTDKAIEGAAENIAALVN